MQFCMAGCSGVALHVTVLRVSHKCVIVKAEREEMQIVELFLDAVGLPRCHTQRECTRHIQ